MRLRLTERIPRIHRKAEVQFFGSLCGVGCGTGLSRTYFILPSWRREHDPSDGRLRTGTRIVRIDRERDGGRFLASLAINPAEVFYNVAALGDPLVEPLGAPLEGKTAHAGRVISNPRYVELPLQHIRRARALRHLKAFSRGRR